MYIPIRCRSGIRRVLLDRPDVPVTAEVVLFFPPLLCYNLARVFTRRDTVAFYTREEAAALQGFLSAYLDRGSVSEALRSEYIHFAKDLDCGHLSRSQLH